MTLALSAHAATAADPASSSPAAATTAHHLGNGRVSLEVSGHTAKLDLGKDIAGCTGQAFDRASLTAAAADVRLEVLDARERGGATFVLLLATAPGNCDVQGNCGGAEDGSAIWLRFDGNLKIVERRSFTVEDCRQDRTSAREDGQPLSRSFRRDGTILHATTTEPGGRAGDAPLERRITYDMARPELGFAVEPPL